MLELSPKHHILFYLPLIPSFVIFFYLNDQLVKKNILISVLISIFGYLATNSLIPIVAEYTLKKNICGKDLGKKGTDLESVLIPEALGLVPGTIFIISAILSQLIFAESDKERMIYNSALFSVCFMIFLGFCDDTLELTWRYKLLLPTIASFPLLASYNGSTAIFIPSPINSLLMTQNRLTALGNLVNIIATVDLKANGSIVELGSLFLLFMGFLAVFCTNSINILAGINGLESGQAYVIACGILFFKFYDIYVGGSGQNQLFAILMILPFIGTTLSLLKYNWFPAKVFVGDTFCYFSGMTFAVIGIHGHFSKTLLLLFIPQILNFIYSIPQLFKILPCPRHRLPKFDCKSGLLFPSTFNCQKHEYIWFKCNNSDTECPNCTLLCLVLRIFGPMKEDTLCLFMLGIQMMSTVMAFLIRYYLFNDKL